MILVYPNGRLTEAGVREIRRLSATGLSLAEVGKRVNISRATVWKVINGRSHKWVK